MDKKIGIISTLVLIILEFVFRLISESGFSIFGFLWGTAL